jgi:hypothetical protein
LLRALLDVLAVEEEVVPVDGTALENGQEDQPFFGFGRACLALM